MTDEEVLRQVRIAFEYSYQHDDWTTPLEEALEGVTAEQALRRPSGAVKGIWDIVLHLAVWNENIVQRVETGEKCRPVEGAWPPPPAMPDEAAWEGAKGRLREALAGVDQLLATTTLDKIGASPYSLGDLLCRLTHNGYHLGQIAKMRECGLVD